MALSGTVPNLVLNVALFSAAAPTWLRRLSGVATSAPVISHPLGASTLIGVNHPGTQNADRVFRFTLDGSTVAFTLPTAATGVTYPTTAAASLTVGNQLEAIALTFAPKYQANATVLNRKGSDASPSTGEFKINGTTVTLGSAGTAGQILEVIIPDPAKITSLYGGTVGSPTAATSGVMTTVTATDFLVAGVARVNLFPRGVQ
jgi:hypothetical protein